MLRRDLKLCVSSCSLLWFPSVSMIDVVISLFVYGKTSVEKSRLTNLQGLALLRLYKSFRRWLWQKTLLFWVGWAQGRAVGSSKICTGFSACWTLLDRFVWQLWAPSAPYVIVPWTLQETKRWIKNNKSGSGSWWPWKDLLCRAMSKLVEIFRVWTPWFLSAAVGLESHPWRSTACWKDWGKICVKNLTLFPLA